MRKVLCLLLCCLLCFMVFAVPASQSAKAVVVSGIIVGTVIAALAAAGIGLSVSGMTSAQLADWVGGKLNTWATSLGGTIQDHIDNNLITVTARGIISVGTAAANGIANFINWLIQDESITDNSSVSVIQSSTMINGYHAYLVDPRIYSGDRYYEISNNTKPVYCIPYRGTATSDAACYMLFVSEATFNWIYSIRPGAVYTSNLYGNFYYISSGNDLLPNGAIRNEVRDNNEILGSLYSSWQETQTPGMAIETGTITVPTIDTSSQDKWFIDVGAQPGTTIQTVTDGVIADTIEGDLIVSGEVAEQEPEFEINGPVAVYGISEVFPFCIPFDLAAFATCLVADPVCPHFEIPFVIPGLVDYTFVIDLSAFETVAQILRTMELLLFCVGLAFVTRKLLRS